MHRYSIFDMMKSEFDAEGTECVSMTHFLRLWRRYLPNIIIPKMSRFSICDTCHKLKTTLASTTDRKARKELCKMREEHLVQQNLERRKYYKHARKARTESGQYLSIILDGMDQDKTYIPHTMATPKSLSNAWKLRVNLMAAIVHDIGIYGFFDPFLWSHGSAYTISCLCHILGMMATLPDVLYLQLDNCPGQNKNRYMLGFLAFLIEANIFKKIKLSFLMVGHTHEDIDQVFSRFSVWLNNHNVWTFDELISGFEKSYTPQPVGMRMHAVYDWPDFLDLNSIVNHSRPHCFKFIKENGKASVYFKKWSTDKEWTKCAGESLLKSFSEAPIACVQPTTQKIDEKVEHDIKLINSFYKNEESQAWWDSFFEDLKLEENTDVDCFNIVQALKEKKVAQQQSRGDVTIEIPSIDKPIPQVIIGSVKAVQTQSIIQEGDMVLCDVERYHDEWPQVARILNIDRDTYKILWYKGSMTGAWTPATRRVKGAKGKTEPYEDIVSKSEIWFSGFRFTPAGNLTRVTKDKLEAYFD